MENIKFTARFVLLFVCGIFALTLLQVSSADANNSNAIASNSGKNGETSFDISHLQLDKTTCKDYSDGNKIGFKCDRDGKVYDFSDGYTYRISNLGLREYKYQDSNDYHDYDHFELVYDIDTPGGDCESLFYVICTVYVDGHRYHTYYHEGVEDEDGRLNDEEIFKINDKDFEAQFGYSLKEGILDDHVVIQMDDIVCNTHRK